MAKSATMEQYSLSAYDVKRAFLNSPIPEDTHVYVRVDPELSDICETISEAKKNVELEQQSYLPTKIILVWSS